jgi:hypothetical protein
MADSRSQAVYTTQAGFTEVAPEHEYLHPDDARAGDYTVGETSYLGFNVPEANISCEIYHWFHPVLGVASGGLMIWRGDKVITSEAEYLDYRNFLPWPEDGIADVTYPTGVRVRVVEPLELVELGFSSPDGSTRFEVESRAIMPAAGRLDGLHFAQAVHNTGELTFEGEAYSVDSYFTRDRSWGRPRPEVVIDEPPLTWLGAAFGDELAIHLTAHDSAELDADGVRWGYVWRDGELREPVAMRKSTVREEGVWAVGSEMAILDSAGESYTIKATGIARLPMHFWPNMLTQLVLMRYELDDGRVTYGDYQDIVFGNLRRSLGA